jgi:NADH-quinone oxidoreductase subunit L
VLAAFAVFVGWPWLIVPVVGGTPVLEHLLASGAPIPVHEHETGLKLAALVMSLVIAGVGIWLAGAFYYWRQLDAEAFARRLAPLYRFFRRKWYFDELYGAVFVRPTLGLAHFASNIDRYVIDALVNGTAWFTAALSRVEGVFDANVVDGIVNLFGKTVYGLGRWSRTVETGRVRSYLMLLIVGLVALFVGMYRWIGG